MSVSTTANLSPNTGVNKVAVIAYCGETGHDWMNSLSDAGWELKVFDTGHRTRRNHLHEFLVKPIHELNNFHHIGGHGGSINVLELINSMQQSKKSLIMLRDIIDTALNEDVTKKPSVNLHIEQGVKVANNPHMKESAVWLNFIIDNYPKLPDKIAFLQGFPLDHCEQVVALLQNAVGKFSCLPEASWIPFKETAKLHKPMADLFSEVTDKNLTHVRWAAGAQFVVSKEVLLNRPISFYRKLMEVANNTPHAAEVMERMWSALLDYEHSTLT